MTPPTISTALSAEILERDMGACQYCGVTVEDGHDLVVSLVVPECAGGKPVPHNLATSCVECFEGKGDSRSPLHEHRRRTWAAVEHMPRLGMDIGTAHLLATTIADAFWDRGQAADLAALNAIEWISFWQWVTACRPIASPHLHQEVN